jgi:hypothetical protein
MGGPYIMFTYYFAIMFIMPTIYDYFRIHQKGKSTEVDCVENPAGSCPSMVRKLYVNGSFCNNSCQYNDAVTSTINEDCNEQWITRWCGGKCPKLCQYEQKELNYLCNSGAKLLYVLEKKIKVLPDKFFLFPKCINTCCIDKYISIYLTIGRMKNCKESAIYFCKPGKYDCKRKIITWDITNRDLCKCKANFISFDICFATNGGCTYIPKFELKFEGFNTDMLAEWFPIDYDRSTYFPKCTTFTDNTFFYNSKLATDGDLFKIENHNCDYPPAYHERNYNTCFIKPDTGIPGPFPYDWPWSKWEGDEKYNFGPHMYTATLMHIGRNIILLLHTKINIKIRDPCSPTKSQDKALANMVNGSTEIFKKFADLIDVNGNPIQYNTSTPAGKLKELFDILITGKGTNDGYLDYQQIIGSFQFFKDTFAPNSPSLQTIINDLTSRVESFLRQNTCACPIRLRSWDYMIKSYVRSVERAYDLYRELYSMEQCDCKYCHLRDRTNDHMLIHHDHAKQFAAFFSIIYSAVAFLDEFLNIFSNPTVPAIPTDFRDDRIEFIHESLGRYWREHAAFFDDYTKASALCREDDMFRSQITHLESCASLSIIVGEIFRSVDNWVRQRGGYSALPGTFAP